TGSWKNVRFRAYNVRGPAARVLPGRRNPYMEFLEGVKDKLVSLGFQEFDGSLVETEFWNSDALFMPQFHSARDIHDVYHLAEPTHAREIEEPFLSNVAAAHENGGETGSRGWGYGFDRDFTRRLILRSQGTVLSARTLPKAEIPGRYFGMARCFRYDKVDATHLSDFYQTEGIVLGPDVNLRTLLGFLEMFAVEVAGAKEVKYVPGYFPFTEPSVEVHIKHPVLGWFELGGSGIFRPEVTEPLGVHVPVLAWGIGIDRMALMALGLNDLRELFSPDIESVRLRRAKI
ncbi:MAG TPA: phenylalanine--tRNA ligase subunit alpha, partial [Spirochaetia bacterium]|nr:phenylalanine--tRNA ligase subunit alpha [Spirochaetia bacterium]